VLLSTEERTPVQSRGEAESQRQKSDSAEQQIRMLAYQICEERGCVDGHDVDDWLEAEAIGRQSSKAA